MGDFDLDTATDRSPKARIATVIVAGLVVVTIAIGALVLGRGDGVSAFSVNGKTTSQRSVDDELRALAENHALGKLAAAGGGTFSQTSGSINPQVSSGWIGLLIGQEVATQEVAEQHLPTTAAARTQGRALAIQSVSGMNVFRTLPQWFRDRLVKRWTPVAVDQLHLLEANRAALDAQTRKSCTSGRFLAHILVKTQAEATTLAQQLAAGADFAQLAAAHSTDTSSAANGGELGCLDSLQLPTVMTTTTTTAAIGKVSDPITLDNGFDLLVVRDAPSNSDLLSAALGAVLAKAQEAHVRVDARYGRWDRSQGAVSPPVVPETVGNSASASPGA